jgi:hypothetical protein
LNPTARATRNLANARRASADVDHLRACIAIASKLPKGKRRASLDRLRTRLAQAEEAAARYVALAAGNGQGAP